MPHRPSGLLRLTLMSAVLLFSCASAAQQTLNISLMLSSGEQRQFFQQAARLFMARHDDVEVAIGVFPDQHYKDNLLQWLKEERYELMYWQSGRRLQALVDAGWVAPIGDIWDEEQWHHDFSDPVQQLVRFDGQHYALPYSYYPWGIYYNRSLFRERDLDIPETWDELIAVARQLRDEGITPFSAGTRSQWPAAGWFDLINLRLNGPEFHQQLLAGEIAYTDERVRDVLKHWQVLVEEDFFMPLHEDRNWRNALPLLYRQRAAMMLIGNFAAYAIPEQFRDEISVFSFPRISEGIPRVELTPTDVFFIPRYARDNPHARAFLRFLGEPAIQQLLNNQSGMLPAHQDAVPGIGLLLGESQRLIDQADDTVQYFDRDTHPRMAETAIDAFQQFMIEPDVTATLLRLEAKRQEVFESDD